MIWVYYLFGEYLVLREKVGSVEAALELAMPDSRLLPEMREDIEVEPLSRVLLVHEGAAFEVKQGQASRLSPDDPLWQSPTWTCILQGLMGPHAGYRSFDLRDEQERCDLLIRGSRRLSAVRPWAKAFPKGTIFVFRRRLLTRYDLFNEMDSELSELMNQGRLATHKPIPATEADRADVTVAEGVTLEGNSFYGGDIAWYHRVGREMGAEAADRGDDPRFSARKDIARVPSPRQVTQSEIDAFYEGWDKGFAEAMAAKGEPT